MGQNLACDVLGLQTENPLPSEDLIPAAICEAQMRVEADAVLRLRVDDTQQLVTADGLCRDPKCGFANDESGRDAEGERSRDRQRRPRIPFAGRLRLAHRPLPSP